MLLCLCAALHAVLLVQVLQEFLLSKLQTLTRHFENDLSVCGIVTWLLRLHLEDLHVATMRAAVSAEASAEPGVEQAKICALLRRHKAVVDYRTVLDLFGQHGHPKLQLLVMDLYGRHVDAFNMALHGVPLRCKTSSSILQCKQGFGTCMSTIVVVVL